VQAYVRTLERIRFIVSWDTSL